MYSRPILSMQESVTSATIVSLNIVMLQQCKNCDNQSFRSTSTQLTTITMSINTLHECQTLTICVVG